jgi:hypothetical protein
MLALASCRVSLAGALCSLLVASAAAAQSAVGPARYLVVTSRTDFLSGTDVTVRYTTPGDYATASGFATVSLRTSPFTLLTAHATTDMNGVRTSTQAYMDYDFRILGAPGTLVSATFTADLFARVVGDPTDEFTLAISTFRLYSPSGEGSFYDSQGNVLASGPRKTLRTGGGAALTFDTPMSFIVDANAEYAVGLSVVSQTATTGVVADASIDPVITIDPAFQSAYSLVLSPGVSNLAPTAIAPEPGSLLLVGTGVVAVAGVVRRRRAAR